MTTQAVVAPFTVETLDLAEIGRTTYVIRNAEGLAVGITFSAKKSERMLAFRIAQLEEAGEEG